MMKHTYLYDNDSISSDEDNGHGRSGNPEWTALRSLTAVNLLNPEIPVIPVNEVHIPASSDSDAASSDEDSNTSSMEVHGGGTSSYDGSAASSYEDNGHGRSGNPEWTALRSLTAVNLLNPEIPVIPVNEVHILTSSDDGAVSSDENNGNANNHNNNGRDISRTVSLDSNTAETYSVDSSEDYQVVIVSNGNTLTTYYSADDESVDAVIPLGDIERNSTSESEYDADDESADDSDVELVGVNLHGSNDAMFSDGNNEASM